MKYIVHQGTGTVIAADECIIVDVPNVLLETLSGDDYFDEVRICEYADTHGKPINTTDLTWSNTVAYSPFAIRDEIRESLMENYEGEGFIDWGLAASDDDLSAVASFILSADDVWTNYTLNLVEGLRWGYKNSKEAK